MLQEGRRRTEAVMQMRSEDVLCCLYTAVFA